MIQETKLVSGTATIIRSHLALFSAEITSDQILPIATKLVQMIHRSESKMALDQYVGIELNKLSVAPNPYEAIVTEASLLVKNSN
jgi:hypothetical protein